eukprot:10406432-Alexandrium_andersonii.AAC.1
MHRAIDGLRNHRPRSPCSFKASRPLSIRPAEREHFYLDQAIRTHGLREAQVAPAAGGRVAQREGPRHIVRAAALLHDLVEGVVVLRLQAVRRRM